MGVFKQNDKYRARYTLKGKTVNVGMFNTREEAQLALDRARPPKQVKVKSLSNFSKGITMEDVSRPIRNRQDGLTRWQRFRVWLGR